MSSLRFIGLIFLLFSLISIVLVESVSTAAIADDGRAAITFTDFVPTSQFGRLTLRISFPQTNQNAEITPSLDLLKYYVAPTARYLNPEDQSLPAPFINDGLFPASTTPSDEIVFRVNFAISSSTAQLQFLVKTIFQTPISLTIEEGPVQDSLTTTYHVISPRQFGLLPTPFFPLTVASVYDLATQVATLVLPRLDLVGFTEDWCLYIKNDSGYTPWTVAGVGGITATIEQSGFPNENVVCFSNLPASYSSLAFQITFTGSSSSPPTLVIDTQLRSQQITDSKFNPLWVSHVVMKDNSDGIPTPTFKLSRIEFAPERFPTLGQNNSIVRWVVTMFSASQHYTMRWLPQLYYDNESFIAFCEVDPDDARLAPASAIAYYQHASFDVPEAPTLTKPFEIHCYGSVSPYFGHRLGSDANSPWGANTIERSPFFANFALDFAWADSTQLDPVTLLPPKSQLPKATLTASSPSLVVSSTQTLLQYSVVIKLPGYTNNFGIELKLPKTSSFISALQTTTPTSLTSLTVRRTAFPFEQIEPVVGDIILSCQDISDSTFTIYLCQWLNSDTITSRQIDATTSVHISTPITLNQEIAGPIPLEVKLIKYHRNSVQYGPLVPPLPVFAATLTSPDITRDPPTIYGYPANHSPSATTIPLAFSQHATFTAPSVPPSAPTTTIDPNRISMNFGTYSASNTAKVAVTYYSFTPTSATTTEAAFTGVEHTIPSTNVVSDTSTWGLDPTKIYFIRVEYTVTTPTGTYKTYFVTEFFKVAPLCATSCKNGGICAHAGTCLCRAGFTGEVCDIDPCSQCKHYTTCDAPDVFDNQPTAIVGGECSCKGSWTGDLCDQPIACEAASQQQCKNKGYLTKLDSTGSTCDLAQDCVCVGNWSGATCATCKGLECKNGGRTSAKTCLCGCATGFLGDRCECRGVDSAITFHGYNQVMLDYLKQVAAAGPASESLTQGYEFVLFHVASVLAELLAVDKQSILNIAATAAGPTPDGDDSNVSTQISFRIYYSCPAHNPALTQPQLTSSFSSNLLPNFVPHPTIKELFVFPSNVDDETTGTIVDVPDSLTDTETDSSEENTATNFSIPNISFFFFFFLIIASI